MKRTCVCIALVFVLVILQVCHGAADYYKVLGLPRDANERQIKTAFRKLSLKYHPDKNKDDPSAEKKFVEVSEAYQVLSDPEKKELYDKYGEDAFKPGGGGHPGGGGGFHQYQGGFGGGGGGFGFQDPFSFFNNMFGGKGGGNAGGGPGMKFSFGQGGGGNPFGGGQQPHGHHQQHQQHQGGARRPGAGAGFGGKESRQGGGGGNKKSTHLYEYTEDIQHLNSKKFYEKVRGTEAMWLVQFYSTSDSDFVDTFLQVAKSLKHFVNVSAVNIDAEQALAKEYEVSSTPHLLLFPFGLHSKRPIKYSEALDAQAIVNFAQSHIPDFSTSISKVGDSFFQDQTLPKVLLFSAKEAATPMYKSLARDMKTKFRFGIASQKAVQVMNNFQIKNVPALIVIERDGNIKHYKGEFKYPALTQFLQGLAGATPEAPKVKLNQHRKTDGDVHELTQANIDSLCGDEICVAVFADADATHNLAVVRDLAAKYSKDGIAFVSVRGDSKFREKLVESTPTKPTCVSKSGSSGVPAMVALRGVKDRPRFSWSSVCSPLEKSEVAPFLEKLVTGDARWTREAIPKDLL